MATRILSDINKAIVDIGNHWQAYLVVIGIPGAAFAWFIKVMKPFSQTGWSWPEAVVLAFAAVMVFGLVAALVMIGYRMLRPLPVVAAPKPEPSAGVLATAPGIREDLDLFVMRLGIVDDLAAGTVELLARTSQKLDAVSGVADLSGAKADAAQATADFAINKLNEREGATEAIDARINDLVEFADRLGSKVAGQGSEVAALLKTVDRLLKAQFAMKTRDALDSIEAAIARIDALLFFPEGKGIEATDWENWKLREESWRQTISTWVRRAAPYGDGDLAARIKNTPQDSFYGSWSFEDSDLPNADTIHRYKAFCIMRRNYFEIKDTIDQAVYEAAYG